MSRAVLIVYGTKHGHTEKISRRVAARLQSRGVSVDLADARRRPENKLENYETVILASGVWYDRHAKGIEKFVFRNLKQLRTMNTVLVSVSNAASTEAGRPTAEAAVDKFQRYTEFNPGSVFLIGGGEPYSKYGWLTKMVMLRIGRKIGRPRDPSIDYDYTDWAAVDAFADAL